MPDLLSGDDQHCVQEREDPTLTDWDRFARAEYVRLAMEEEGEFRASDNSNEIWVQQSLEVSMFSLTSLSCVAVLSNLKAMGFETSEICACQQRHIISPLLYSAGALLSAAA